MWVWQSQACGGTSKLTGVEGCEAFAKLVRPPRKSPEATAPARMSRRVGLFPMFKTITQACRFWRRLALQRVLSSSFCYGHVGFSGASRSVSQAARERLFRDSQSLGHRDGALLA